MKKLLAGVAALALSAGAANAGSFDQGASTIGGANFSGNNTYNPLAWVGGGGGARPGQVANGLSVGLGGEEVASWIEASGSVANNVGTASLSDGATFTLRGEVSQDCSFYTGNINTTLNFGQIGIHTEDTAGLDVAFDMVGPAQAQIETNVAGCNTANEVRISKANGTDGLRSNYGGNFDSTQFTNALPYQVVASWTGVADGNAGAVAPSAQSLTVAANEGNDALAQGAWKSHFVVDVTIPVPTQSLVSGVYTDNLTITLQAL